MNLNDLGGTPLNDGVDVANLPEQMGSFAPPPPPGSYRFELPLLKPEAFAGVQHEQYGARVQVKFNDDFPLKIVQAPDAAKDEFLNTPFRTTISNIPRKRGKGDDAPIASDWDYLNKALAEAKRPPSNADYARALIAQSAKTPRPTFKADVEWGWSCNPNRDARFDDGQGGSVPVQVILVPEGSPEGTPGVPQVDPNTQEPINVKGCGERRYQGGQNGVQKIDGVYPLRITCKCGATVRAFPNLARFEA